MKTPEDVQQLADTLRENLANDHRQYEGSGPSVLAKLVFDEGQVLMLYKTGTAVVQGSGYRSDIASICRAEGWKCKMPRQFGREE